MDVLFLHGNALVMDGAQVAVLKIACDVCLARLVGCHERHRLAPKLMSEKLYKLSEESSESELWDQGIR